MPLKTLWIIKNKTKKKGRKKEMEEGRIKEGKKEGRRN